MGTFWEPRVEELYSCKTKKAHVRVIRTGTIFQQTWISIKAEGKENEIIPVHNEGAIAMIEFMRDVRELQISLVESVRKRTELERKG